MFFQIARTNLHSLSAEYLQFGDTQVAWWWLHRGRTRGNYFYGFSTYYLRQFRLKKKADDPRSHHVVVVP